MFYIVLNMLFASGMQILERADKNCNSYKQQLAEF